MLADGCRQGFRTELQCLQRSSQLAEDGSRDRSQHCGVSRLSRMLRVNRVQARKVPDRRPWDNSRHLLRFLDFAVPLAGNCGERCGLNWYGVLVG